MINYSEVWKKSLRLKQVPYDEFVSIPFTKGTFLQKLDGMLGTFIYNKNGQSFFQTSGGNSIYDIPVIDEYINILNKLGIEEIKIPGELIAKVNGKILPFNEIVSVVKRFKEPQNKNLIYHYPVDIFSLNNKDINFDIALKFIKTHFGKAKFIQLPKTAIGDLNVFRKLFEQTMVPGYDGVVARGVNNKNYKIKFVNSVDLVIIGAGHITLPAWQKKQVSYLISAFLDKNGIFRMSSKIGTGFKESDRKYFYDYVLKNKLYEKNGNIYIKPTLMVEIDYFRYRFTGMDSLTFNGKEYINKSFEKSITFSHPTFIRIRNDKEVNKMNARLEQIPEWSY